MDYQEAREYIDGIQESLGSDYSLEEVTELARRMGNPEQDLKIIHIAGTNGKGSVGNFIANILAVSGYSVGRYVSPAVVSYRERIQRMLPVSQKSEKGSEFISRDEVAQMLTELRGHCEDMLTEGHRQPTAFEIETVMALAMCQEWNVDFVILECGLGGEMDATNFISSPLLCVFTSISKDHMSLLGNSIPEIASQKYGIIKENSVVVSGKQEECMELLRKICADRKAELHLIQEDDIGGNADSYSLQQEGGYGDRDACRDRNESDIRSHRMEQRDSTRITFCYQGERYRLSQPAVYQVENAKLAIEAVSQIARMGYAGITKETKKQGIWNSYWRGRFEILSTDPFILLDGAHNGDAMEKLCLSLQANFPDEKFVFVTGFFADKEYRKMIERLLPLADRILTVTAPGKRGLSGDALAEEIRDIIRNGQFTTVVEKAQKKDDRLRTGYTDGDNGCQIEFMDSMEQALRLACDFGKKVVICGSLSILRWVYEYLEKE